MYWGEEMEGEGGAGGGRGEEGGEAHVHPIGTSRDIFGFFRIADEPSLPLNMQGEHCSAGGGGTTKAPTQSLYLRNDVRHRDATYASITGLH